MFQFVCLSSYMVRSLYGLYIAKSFPDFFTANDQKVPATATSTVHESKVGERDKFSKGCPWFSDKR